MPRDLTPSPDIDGGMAGYGQVAYDTYGAARGWETVAGQPMPHWHDQDPSLQQAWNRAAYAVIDTWRKDWGADVTGKVTVGVPATGAVGAGPHPGNVGDRGGAGDDPGPRG